MRCVYVYVVHIATMGISEIREVTRKELEEETQLQNAQRMNQIAYSGLMFLSMCITVYAMFIFVRMLWRLVQRLLHRRKLTSTPTVDRRKLG